jgi:hypothetical protein
MTYFTTFEAPDAGFRLVAGRPRGLQRLLVASGRLPAGQPGHMHLHAGDEVLGILSGELIVGVVVRDRSRSLQAGASDSSTTIRP